VRKTKSPRALWKFNHKCRSISPGLSLRVEVLEPAVLHWSLDGWRSVTDSETRDTGLGLHVVDLPVEKVAPGGRIDFTFRWPQANRWEERDFSVLIAPSSLPEPRTT
jgi:glucoamylase